MDMTVILLTTPCIANASAHKTRPVHGEIERDDERDSIISLDGR